jgi:alkylation response protein AidB-like acyl-CoA dehydrogenase
MDFNFNEEQTQVRELSRQILRDNCSDEFLARFSKKMLKENGPHFSRELWKQFADAGLLGTAVPEASGGSGFGLIEICQILEEQGRHVAPLPLLPSLVLGGLPLAKYGSNAQQEKYLAPLASGDSFLTAAIAEESMVPALRARCVASEKHGQWHLDGLRVAVPYAKESAVMLVAATLEKHPDQRAVFLVEAQDDAVTLEFTNSGNYEPFYAVNFEHAQAEVLGSVKQGEEILNYLLNVGAVACAATMVGITEESARRTALFTAERKQFETTIASFQNTTMKMADCYIDIEALRSAYYEALWKLSHHKACDAEVKVAKYWASMAGHRVTHTCQHLHGGIGADVEYPLHRYYLWFKQMDLMMGGGTKQLADLGALLAQDDSINLLKNLA